MSNETYYIQCGLKKGNRRRIAWLPTEIPGWGTPRPPEVIKTLGYGELFDEIWIRIKDRETGEWEDGWLVEHLYKSNRRTEEDVLACERDHLKQRAASDI